MEQFTDDFAARLRSSEVFACLPSEVLEGLASSAEPLTLATGALLVREGEASESVYLLMHGALEVTRNGAGGEEHHVGSIGEGGLIGEIQLFTGGNRTATVRASCPSAVLVLERRRLEAIAVSSPLAWRELTRVVNERLMSRHLEAALTKAFGPLERAQLETLNCELERRQLEAGDMLFRVGNEGVDSYLVVSGALRVYAEDGGVLGEIGAGELAGDVALLCDSRRTADVVALRPTHLVRIDRETFLSLMQARPESMLHVTGPLIRRLQHRQRGRSAPQVIALIPAHAGVGVRELALSLRAEVVPRPALVLGERELEEQGIIGGVRTLGADASAWLRLTTWLEEQRRGESLVLLMAESGAEGWMARCVAEADLVLVVGHGQEAPPIDLLERIRGARRLPELERGSGYPPLWCVLLHPSPTTRPHGTARWLERLSPAAHFHLREGSASDLGRLTRFVRGQAVGLALSGGGLRGAAHLGVYRALREFGIEIDYAAGTSAGSVVAALIASDSSYETIDAQFRQTARIHGSAWRSLTLPFISLMRGRLERSLQALWGDQHFEDAWIPHGAVAANLTRASKVVFESGPIWRGVLASCSPPAIMAPVVIDGELHSDGGVVDNLPVEVLGRRGCRYKLASNVGAGLDRPMPSDEVPSPWRLLFDRVLGRVRPGPRFPTLPEIAVRAMGMTSDSGLATALANTDLTFLPPTGAFGLGSIQQTSEIIETGYTHARAVLKECPAGLFGGRVLS